MFSRHHRKELSAYCNGELSAAESRHIAEHLLGCERCRTEYEAVKLGVKLAEMLPLIAAPDSLWTNIEAEFDSGRADAVEKVRPASFGWRPRLAAVGAALLLAVGVVVGWVYLRESRPFWSVARLSGSPRIGAAAIADKGQLARGEWLETDADSRAKIEVASIGQVEIDPNTRVRLVETNPTEHRLELERGRMSARIWAPPRLFFVDTPSAVAADLGCAYTLEVDKSGAGLLRVTSGWVALQLHGHESMVPAGAACATRPVVGPGTPYFEDASDNFRTALSQLDFGSQEELEPALTTVISESRVRDTLTLWHLLPRVAGSARERIYERLASLGPPPEGVTRDGILQLNEQMLQRWKDSLENTWSDQSRLKRAWLKIWTRAVGKIKGMQGRR